MFDSNKKSDDPANKIVYESEQEKQRCISDPVCDKLREDASHGVFRLTTDDRRSGSGWLSPDGRIVTDYHVLEGAKEVKLEYQGKSYNLGKTVAVDRQNDLAILDFETEKPADAKGLTLADRPPSNQEALYAFSFKANDSAEIAKSLQFHRCNLEMRASGRDGLVDSWGEDGVERRLRQEKDQAKPSYLSATAAVNKSFDYAWIGTGHGSSGAPVFNSDGQVSSVVDWGSSAFPRRNLTTPVSYVQDLLKQQPVNTSYYRSGMEALVKDGDAFDIAQAGVATGIGGMVANSIRQGIGLKASYPAAALIIANNTSQDYESFMRSTSSRDKIKNGAALAFDSTMAAGLVAKVIVGRSPIGLGLLAAGAVGRVAAEFFPNRLAIK
jgi:hypothetical protein